MKIAYITLFLQLCGRTLFSAEGRPAENDKEVFSGPAEERPCGIDQSFVVELCLIKHKEYKDAFTNEEVMTTYFATLINSVNLRYVDMKHPNITFALKKVSVIEKSQVTVFRQQSVDAAQTLVKLVKFLSKGCCKDCDVVFFVTSYPLELGSGSSYVRVHGLAYGGSVCTKKKVGVVQDLPLSYSSSRTLAHELAHTLGATHDGDTAMKLSYNTSGAECCPATEEYLMGRGNLGIRKYMLSNCTMNQIQAHYCTLKESCTQVQSTPSHSNNKYPGQGMTPDKFCKLLLGKESRIRKTKEELEKECVLVCSTPSQNKKRTSTKHSMLDGMECSPNMTCKRGVCGVHSWDET